MALFVDDHGSYRLKTVDVGNIKCLHAGKSLHPQKMLDLFHRADGSSLLAFDLLAILGKYIFQAALI